MLTVSIVQSVGAVCGCYYNEEVGTYLLPFLVKEER